MLLIVVCRASPLKNEAPRGAGSTEEAGAEGVEETGTCVSVMGTEAGAGGTGAAGSAGGGALTGEAVLVLVDAAGVGLGWRWG